MAAATRGESTSWKEQTKHNVKAVAEVYGVVVEVYGVERWCKCAAAA
jgi:hypothetical protein